MDEKLELTYMELGLFFGAAFVNCPRYLYVLPFFP